MTDFYSPEIILEIILLALHLIAASIVVPIVINNHRYKKFVRTHSVAYKTLLEINKNYSFKNIPNFDMVHSYDNENFYDDISCEDYLTYQLVFIQKKVSQAMRDTLSNKELMTKYNSEIKEKCVMEQYDTEELLRNKNKLKKTELKEFNKAKQAPVVLFFVDVKLVLTNINGSYQASKLERFFPNKISTIIHQLNQKRGSYYTNEWIWNSICRVERGKVSNKMRFAIYKRDHNRCRRCGSRYNLEVDHIIPIAKGGKSTYDNLQTLCHRCNVRKGSSIE